MSENSGKTWLLSSPKLKIKFGGNTISENELNNVINEIVLDTSGTECPIPVLKARKLSQ